MYLIDAHEDLAYNALNFGRDYLRAAAEIRESERRVKSPALEHNGLTLLGWPDYQRARTAVVFATLFASPERYRMGDWNRLFYRAAAGAHDLYRAQADIYRRWVDENPEKFTLIRTKADLAGVVAPWENGEGEHPVGLVILMEGAEGVRDAGELELWWELGVRIIGPAWSGTRFCGGTGEPGPLTDEGFELLDAMAEWDFILDLSHMDEQAALQALDRYPGRIIASHANALALVKGSESNRHLSDRVIRGLLERDGVIGVVPYNPFLKAGWVKGDPRTEVSLDMLAAHIDHICQLAGDARHAGIGSDFDGGFGAESTPAGLDTIADLHALVPLLLARGYAKDDAAAILGANWKHLLESALPE